MHHAGEVLVIDGDALRRVGRGQPLPMARAGANLAVLLAQLPAEWDDRLSILQAPYCAAAASAFPEPQALRARIAHVRAWRLRDFLGKTVRDCTLFAVEQTLTRFTAVLRRQADALAALLPDPDAALDSAVVLKDGGTCTVARIVVDERVLLLKRYNLKSLGHALNRCWRPTRAWHSWREAHRLQFLGIPTPAPLALVEERIGPLRRRAWLVQDRWIVERLERQQLVDAAVRPGGSFPGCWSARPWARCHSCVRFRAGTIAAARWPAASEPANSQFFLPDGDGTNGILDRVVIDRVEAIGGMAGQG